MPGGPPPPKQSAEALLDRMIMDSMLAGAVPDDPNFILQNLSLITSILPEEKTIFDKARDAQLIVAAQISFLCACALEGLLASAVHKERHARTHKYEPLVNAGSPIIGIIGCGQIGAGIAEGLLEHGVAPSTLAVCARNDTTTLAALRKRGVVTCDFAASLIDPSVRLGGASTAAHHMAGTGSSHAGRTGPLQCCRVLVLACGPAHLVDVATALRGRISRATLVVNAVGSVPLAKVRAATHAMHAVDAHIEPSMLSYKWDMKLTVDGMTGGTASSEPSPARPQSRPESGAYAARTVDGAKVAAVSPAHGASSFLDTLVAAEKAPGQLGDLATYLSVSRGNSAGATALRDAARHLAGETDAILHTFEAVERYFTDPYGLACPPAAARGSARRAVLGVVDPVVGSAPDHPHAGNAATSVEGRALAAAREASASSDAASMSLAARVLEGLEDASEDSNASTPPRLPSHVIAEALRPLEMRLYPAFHGTIAKKLRAASIPSEDVTPTMAPAPLETDPPILEAPKVM